MHPWLFRNPGDAAALQHYRETLVKIDRWWQVFAARTEDLSALFARRQKWDLPAWMCEHLQSIHPMLMWEFGPGLTTRHRLVITAESRRYLRPLVNTIIERAPRLDDWSFHAYRVPEDMEQTLLTVKGRTGGDLSETRVLVRRGDWNRVDLIYESPRFTVAEEAFGEVFVATETLLGEEVLDRWVGAIESTARLEEGRPITVKSLKPTVDAVIGSIVDQLPDRPYFELNPGPTGAVFQMEPEPDQEDYPGFSDLLVASSALQGLWQAVHGDRFFDSRRFSRRGERFCYLKLDGSEGLDEEKFADRHCIEEALDAALGPAELGGTFGGGTGLRYSYIDLALTDVPRAAEVIRRVLQDGNIPIRSWLLFFDCEWKYEWIGIWDDSPSPPQEPAEE